MLAAGVGNRLDRSGNGPPKALLRFAGESLLKRHLDMLVQFGLVDVTIVVGHRAEEIERELTAAGFELVAVGTTAQVVADAMPDSAAGLRGQRLEGTLYVACRKA